MTPREAIAKQLWLRTGQKRSEADWPAYFAWYEDEVRRGNVEAAKDSAIGAAVAKAERILRLIEAAGLRVQAND